MNSNQTIQIDQTSSFNENNYWLLNSKQFITTNKILGKFKNSFQHIPIEVIQHNILSFLRHSELKICRLVCKLWQEWCRNTKTSIILSVQLKFDEEQLVRGKGFGFHDWQINSLKIVNNNVDQHEYVYCILNDIVRKSELECLSLEKRVEFSEKLGELVLKFPNLKYFSLNSTNLTNHRGLTSIVSQLETFKIRVMNLDHDFLRNVTCNFGTNLVNLYIEASFIGNEHIKCLTECNSARRLKILEIISRRQEKFIVNASFGKFIVLEELGLDFGASDANNCLNEIAKIESLKRLSLTRMELGDISHHFKKMRNLESLSLHNCNFQSLDNIDELEKLKSLSLKGRTIGEEDVIQISQLELSKLSLESCGMCANLICKQKRMNSLKELLLIGGSVSVEDISQIGREFFQLKTLLLNSIPIDREKLRILVRNDLFSNLRNLSLIACNLNDDHLDMILDPDCICSRLYNLNIDLNDFSEHSLKCLQNQTRSSGVFLSTRTRKSSLSSVKERSLSKEKQGCLFQ